MYFEIIHKIVLFPIHSKKLQFEIHNLVRIHAKIKSKSLISNLHIQTPC